MWIHIDRQFKYKVPSNVRYLYQCGYRPTPQYTRYVNRSVYYKIGLQVSPVQSSATWHHFATYSLCIVTHSFYFLIELILKLCHFDRQNLKGSNQTPAILLSVLANTATFKSSLSDSLHNRHKPTWSRNDPNKECFQFITWTLYTSIFNILRYVNLTVKQAVIHQDAFYLLVKWFH